MNATATKPETNEQEVARRFPLEIAKHGAKILLRQGVYRHIDCRAPGTFSHAFTVTTWPGYLAITGDVGSFVFTRLHDMFDFFRADHGRINPSYWAEKLVATNKGAGHKAFSEDLFIAAVRADLASWLEGATIDPATQSELEDAVEEQVIAHAYDSSNVAMRAAMDFEWKGERLFREFYNHRLDAYTYHFLWCCHAIVWAIGSWDAIATAWPTEAEVVA